MFTVIRFLVLIGVAVAAPINQEQVQQVPIPFFVGQNGILALVPINALQSQNSFSQTQERVMLPATGSSPFNSGSIYLLNPMNSQGTQPLSLAIQQPTRVLNVQSNPKVVATTQAVVATPVAASKPVVAAPLAATQAATVVSPVAVPANQAGVVAPVAVATTTIPATSATIQAVAAPSVAVAVDPKISTVNANAGSDYSFTYLVNDPVTGDAKTVSESRQGDRITGSYTVNDPDGIQRTVNYVADPLNGFQAKVDLKQTGITPPAAPSTPQTPAGSSAASGKSSAVATGSSAASGKPSAVAASGGMNPGASASAQVSLPSGSWGWNSNSTNA